MSVEHANALQLFDEAPGIVRADLGRLLVLYHFGGVYADLDYECLGNISGLLGGDLLLTWDSPSATYLSNAIMGSVRGSKFIEFALEEGLRRWSQNGGSVEHTTGPYMLTDVYRERYPEAPVLKSSILSPVDWRESGLALASRTLSHESLPLLRRKLQAEGALAVTYWTHFW